MTLLYAIPYLSFFGFFFLIGFFELTVKISKKVFWQSICVCGGFVLFVLKGYVFTDFITYHGHFESLTSSNIFENSSFSPFYSLLSFTFKSLGLSFDFWMRLVSLVNLIFLVILFRYYSVPFGFGFALMIALRGLILDFNLWQNYFSILLFFCSLKFYLQGKIYIFVVASIVGLFAHPSYLVFLTVLPILTIKFSRRIYLVLYFLFVGLSLFSFRWPIHIIEVVLGLIRMEWVVPYLEHLTAAEDHPLSLGYALRLILFIYLIFNFNFLARNCRHFTALFNLAFLYFAVYLIFAPMQLLVDRVGLLFLPAVWILLSKSLIGFSKHRVWKHFFLFLIGTLLIAKATSNSLSEYQNIIFGADTVIERKASVLMKMELL